MDSYVLCHCFGRFLYYRNIHILLIITVSLKSQGFYMEETVVGFVFWLGLTGLNVRHQHQSINNKNDVIFSNLLIGQTINAKSASFRGSTLSRGGGGGQSCTAVPPPPPSHPAASTTSSYVTIHVTAQRAVLTYKECEFKRTITYLKGYLTRLLIISFNFHFLKKVHSIKHV